MKHFVLTSSSSACSMPRPDEKFSIDENTWNDESVKLAYGDPSPMKGMHVYGASKTLAEKALWKFQKEQNPHFTMNAVLPNFNWGLILAPGKSWDSSGGMAPLIYNGGLDGLGPYKFMPPRMCEPLDTGEASADKIAEHHVDVQDVGRLHVAPLLDSSIKDERIFAFGSPFNMNDALDIIRKLRPNKEIPDTRGEYGRDLCVIKPRPRAEKILQDTFGRQGFTSLEDSIANNIAHLP